ncbi:MAG: hypothetical protein CVU99_02495 [Firmicutes bacterium HGW-Firmicutes-4]|jgi:hypothetical protein|nr:MAG: hypothetical protein CVU99_02495 [Firmicutes bacterium HGW-Firmicutes-4]
MTIHKVEVMTLCNRCADVIQEDEGQTIRRVDPKQRIQEACFICGFRGFDYEVKNKEKVHEQRTI